MRPLFTFILSFLALSAPANAKDLSNRLGIGFQNQVCPVTCISARYGLPLGNPAINVQLELDGGFSYYQAVPEQLFLGGRLLYAVVVEDNMNLYAAGGAGVVNEGGASTVRLQPSIEAQAFPFGLENLGFTLGVGVNIDVGGGVTGAGTTGSVLSGAHYWF